MKSIKDQLFRILTNTRGQIQTFDQSMLQLRELLFKAYQEGNTHQGNPEKFQSFYEDGSIPQREIPPSDDP